MAVAVLAAVAACLLSVSVSDAYFFQSGFSHHYTYEAENSLFGHQNITTVLKFHVSHINETESGGSLHSLVVDSLVQYIKDGALQNNPLKWDLSKTFLFESDTKGSVTLVHCHPQDHEELVFIKKAMVSVFSVHVKTEEDREEWRYSTLESDHLGSLQHDYNVQKTGTGMKILRTHSSASDAHRTHSKVLHYDHQGTLHFAEAHDKVLLKNHGPKEAKRLRIPGERVHKITTSGDFPEIEASATVRVTLEARRPWVVSSPPNEKLVQHPLQTMPKVVKRPLSEVERNITESFACIRRFPEKDDVNRSLCINNLRELLKKLNQEDYAHFVNNVLKTTCKINDSSCEDHRLIIIDVVARIADDTSQELLRKHVLSKTRPVNEELRRVFMHCVAIERPTEEFVAAVERFCFGENGELHGTRVMNRTQVRACLAVGTLARKLHHDNQAQRAERLAERLESWLDHHGKGDSHVSKRDTWLEETMHEDHHLSKAVLLHALGNAALPRSRRHILLHAQANRGHHMWRRAALDALRHYTCNESARAIFNSLLHDEKHTVRQMALAVYLKHPQRHTVTKQQEDTILSRNYTYQAVARVKRSLLDKVLFKFRLELPRFDWKKVLGSKDIGASFGAYFDNRISALFRVLNGYVDVSVHDKVWAEVHVGLINKHWDILLMEICYRGRLSYNTNIMKDFTVGMFKDISSAFDHIANRLVEPMERSANKLATMYQDPSTDQPKSGFDLMAQTVRELPLRTETALEATVNLTEAAELLEGIPLVTRLQQLSTKAQSLMEDVHSETTEFFSNVKDAAVIALPLVEKEIRSNLNLVLENLPGISQAPSQVTTIAKKASLGYKLAMQRMLEANNVIKQATSFLSGSKSNFLNAGQELASVVESTRRLLQRLKNDHARRKRQANPFDDTDDSMSDEADDALQELYDRADDMIRHLSNVTAASRDLQTGLDQHALYTELLKTNYESFKEAIDMVKSRITALMGQKFHPDFPDQKRDCDDRCGCGYYPTDCNRYGHPGVDMKLDKGWRIYSPVSGLMTSAGNQSIAIRPDTPDFAAYEIIISNIDLNVSIVPGGTYVEAGQILGVVAGENGCLDGHFNLAMKRYAPDSAEDLCYYVDPSPFIDRMQPIPKWTQECRDYNFKHIGQLVDFNNLSSGFAPLLEELKRLALDAGKQLLLNQIKKMPDTGFLGVMKGFADEIVTNIDPDPANLKNLFNKGKGQMKGFFDNISTKNFNLNGLKNMARKVAGAGAGTNGSLLTRGLSRVTGLIGLAKNMTQNPTFTRIKSMAMGGIGRILANKGVMAALPPGVANVLHGASGILGIGGNGSGLPSFGQGCGSSPGDLIGSGLSSIINSGINKLQQSQFALKPWEADFARGVSSSVSSFIGGKVGMMAGLKSSSCSMCASFGNALARATGSSCMAHSDCLGVDCDVNIQNALVKARASVGVKVYPDQKKVVITAGGRAQILIGNAFSKKISVQLRAFKIFTADLQADASWTGKELRFSLSLKACAKTRCLPTLSLMKNIKFDPFGGQASNGTNNGGNTLNSLDTGPLDGVAKTFSDFNFPMRELVGQIGGIQGSISSALKPSRGNRNSSRYTMKAEFRNPLDQVDTGNFPAPGENSEINLQFFYFVFAYPVGPCLLQIEFNAAGALGLSFDVKVKALDSHLITEVKPWVAVKIDASLSLNFVIAEAGVTLTGYLMKTGFPLVLTTNYTKQPVITTKSLQVELIPLELKLNVFVTVLWVISYKKTVWHWTAPAVRGVIWEKEYRKDDTGPPRFPYCNKVAEQCGRGKRSAPVKRSVFGSGGCTVKQEPGRHPNDAAFKLEFAVEDDDSDLKLWYAIGDYQGGTNVVSWTEMRGASLLSPAVLPCGLPLYFMVRARNSQGQDTIGHCSIPTYDCTFPDGRVDAAYRCSSHPSKLSAEIVIYEDSPLKENAVWHGVGYSPSFHGHEVVDWTPLVLSNDRSKNGVTGPLAQFSSSRPGRLATTPKKTLKFAAVGQCASECLSLPSCLSFTYSTDLRDCEIFTVKEGTNMNRNSDKSFVTYEKLGLTYTAHLQHENLPLRNGTMYFINADIENALGYRSVLTSKGTMIDFTPPNPGSDVKNALSDVFVADGCGTSILQRCVEAVPSALNHRKIIDGDGSSAVFNGNRRGQEIRHTIENYRAGGNWEPFQDKECGILGYTWAVGTTVCGADVVSFRDPHAVVPNHDDWTHTGLARDLHLLDGQYYVTVQAVNDIIHGGDLVTTVCHSTPFIVDTSPPVFFSIDDFIFDETFRILVVYYNASDDNSNISKIEFGLGKTKYDVAIRRYTPVDVRGIDGNRYIVSSDFETAEGVPAWIRLNVVNNVYLSATGASRSPILLDSSPPIPGHVLDGSQLGLDLCCQSDTSQICAQWSDFLDPESLIDSFYWGVGLIPGKDDIVAFHQLPNNVKHSCVDVQLTHNTTYFSTVVAFNKALNQKSVNTSSDGILVDVSPPVAGLLADGKDINNDVNFTSETATVAASWKVFYDGESGLRSYSVSVIINDHVHKTFADIDKNAQDFADHSFSLQHGDYLQVQLLAKNRAGLETTVMTDGALVDHTPPELLSITTGQNNLYQTQDDHLSFSWEFQDRESGIAEYRYTVFQRFQNQQTRFWPKSQQFFEQHANDTTSSLTEEELNLSGLKLQNGAKYSLKVTAINGARISASEQSPEVIIDTTPPTVRQLKLARKSESEETTKDNDVEHVNGEPLWITWLPHDSESGITQSHICIAPAGSSDCLASALASRTVDGFDVPTASFRDLNLQVSVDHDNKHFYQAYVSVVNGAGVSSAVAQSKRFYVLQANVAGTVTDGREEEDSEFSYDASSVAVRFSGFASDACGIVGYEWGIGTSPFATDIMPFSREELVWDEKGTGFAQAHVTQEEGKKYFSTVRAETGQGCHEEYVVASSDGFTLDITPPQVTYTQGAGVDISSQSVVYQANSEHLPVLWHVEDLSGVKGTWLDQDMFRTTTRKQSVPAALTDPLVLSSYLQSGDSLYSSLIMTDNSGNEAESLLPLVTFDFTPPVIQNLNCTKVLSAASSLLTCDWTTVDEEESTLSSIKVGLGSGPSASNLLNLTDQPLHENQWNMDAREIISLLSAEEIFVIFSVETATRLKTEVPFRVLIDSTPPSLTSVSVVTSPSPGFHDVEQKCQTSQDYIEILLNGLQEPESVIESVEFALGSSKGRTDIKHFLQYSLKDGMYVIDDLALTPGSTVFVTARVTNNVGLYRTVESQSIVISPEPRVEVRDGGEKTDMDGQLDLNVLEGQWIYTDPCPVVKAEWSVSELGGKTIVNITTISGSTFYKDDLQLENFKTYISYVRVTDALNRTITAFSDGVTVLVRLPEAAAVRDGHADQDQDFQEPVDRLSANWDTFGNPRSTLPSDQILRYEAAVGTDRRFPATRADVFGFEDLQLSTNVTFFGLNLTAKSTTYFVTVRAYSAAGSFVESSSDGIRVGYSADLLPGHVHVDPFQSSTDNIRLSWGDFTSDMPVTHYFAGVSSTSPRVGNKSHDCAKFFKNMSAEFDVSPLENMYEESMAVIEDLKLTHREEYYVTIVALNQMGQCVAVVSEAIRVDTTRPQQGLIKTGNTEAEAAIFLHSPEALEVDMSEFQDPESGVKAIRVDLLSSTECDIEENPEALQTIATLTVQNETLIYFRNLELMERVFYFLKTTVTNGAGLETKATSKPMLLDLSPPLPGNVKLTTDWTAADKTFQSDTDYITGITALRPLLSEDSDCPTQIDLFDAALLGEWTKLTDEFSDSSAGFDDSGSLQVVIQHNRFLTGIDKGAMQSGNRPWREGDHVFRLTAGADDQILSGISITSPSLKPPYLTENSITEKSQLPCDPSQELCLEDRNNTVSDGAMESDASPGAGLTFFKQEGQTKLLFWVKDELKLKQSWIPLGFDPTITEAEYILRLKKEQGSTVHSWKVTVLINGEEKVAVSGRVLTGDFVVSVYTWNIKGAVPNFTDPFNPFRAAISVSAISLPLDQQPLCSYGEAFQDTVSGIREISLGVSDSYNATANVVPFRVYRSFCMPCLLDCKLLCDSCVGKERLDSNSFKTFPLRIDGLTLQAGDVAFKANQGTKNKTTSGEVASSDNSTEAELRQYQLPTYFLDVRVTDHSGRVTDVKSAGLVVDTSPPVINDMYCFDPTYSRELAVSYLGNNYTVGVTWDASEDISDIAEVKLSLGTQPGLDDVVPQILVQHQTEYIFTNLSSPLEEAGVYYITVEAVNEAGLSTEAWSNFTVDTIPPDMSSVTPEQPNVTSLNFSGVEMGVMESSERLQIDLNFGATGAAAADVQYYELSIGTGEGSDDVFPRTVVGDKNTKTITIANGFVQRDEAPAGISVGDYAKKNYSSSDMPDPSANNFRMEPGRCLRQQVIGVSKAHVSTTINLKPTCVKRPNDVVLEADGVKHELSLDGSSVHLGNSTSSSKNSVHVNFKMSRGALMAGVLTKADLSSQYGSSASAEYSPFIVQPDPGADQTSRPLRKRLVDMDGPSFYLSPVADAEFDEDIAVSYEISHNITISQDSSKTVSLLVWDPDLREWELVEERCPNSIQHYDNKTRLFSVQVCPDVFRFHRGLNTTSPPSPADTQRKKRSVTTDETAAGTLNPRMLTVSTIKTSVPNLPPLIHNTSYVVMEDSDSFNFTITYTDPEGDVMTFRVAEPQPRHGSAHVTQDGRVVYRSDPDYSGPDVIHVVGYENLDAASLALGIKPNIINFTITVDVTDTNDPPAIFYLPSRNDTVVQQEIMVGISAGNGLNVSVYVEGNTTTTAELGVVVFGDVDQNDTIHFFNKTVVNNGAEIEVNDIDSTDPRLTDVILTSPANVTGKDIILRLPEAYNGHVSFSARARDASNAYSMQLTLNVYVLINPCYHGLCQPRPSTFAPCSDATRALTFEPYFCQCDLGYEGEWCQTETDECRTATCSPITDCVDLIGGYRCDPNPTKLAAIVVCPIAALVVGLFALWRMKKKSSKIGFMDSASDDFKKDQVPYQDSSADDLKKNPDPTHDDASTSGSPETTNKEFGFMSLPLFTYNPVANPTMESTRSKQAQHSSASPASASRSTSKSPGKLSPLRVQKKVLPAKKAAPKKTKNVVEPIAVTASAENNSPRPSSSSSSNASVSTGSVTFMDDSLPKVES